MPKLGWLLVAVCLIASLVATAAGDDPEPAAAPAKTATRPASDPSRNLLDAGDLAAYPEASPEHAVLAWAQAVQFSDALGARRAYSRRVLRRVSSARLDAAVHEIGELFGRPRIVGSQHGDGRATVRVVLESFEPGSEKPAFEQPTTFTLVRDGRRWQLDDVSLLLATADDLRTLRSGATAAERPAP